MGRQMTKHSGAILTEVLISILLFTIGLLALMGAITFSVGSIMKSREAINSDMEITNKTEMDAMILTISPDVEVSELSGKHRGGANIVLTPRNGDPRELSLSCGLYLYEYEQGGRRKTTFYLLKRED